MVMTMKKSVQTKLEELLTRHQKIGAELMDPNLAQDQKKFREFSKEYARLQQVVDTYEAWKKNQAAHENAKVLLEDPDMQLLAEEEIKTLVGEQEILEEKLLSLLIPPDPNDDRNVYIEIRGGAGGDEAAIFAGDLFRMYARYVEQQSWKIEIISASQSDRGGYKEVIARILGKGVYAKLKFESGAHRVQRVPETESAGRIHTSTCTVAILPEAEEIDHVEINPAEIRIDTFRASGAGGQHVQKTDSAIRVTHIPSGLVVECQEERSQHQNKARALALLQTRLFDMERTKQLQKEAATRKSLVGTGDRSERIRTYNFPQGRLTDHRINVTLYSLDKIIEGDLDQIIIPLQKAHQADELEGKFE